MDSDRIEQLLAKYWEGQSSLEEEEELRSFFNQGPVPERWASVAPLFRYFQEEKRYGKPGDVFDKKIISQIKATERPEKAKVVRLFYNAARVAAIGAILFVAVYFVKEEYMTKKEKLDPYITGTLQDPQEAFEETKKALMMISKNLNMGRKQAQKVAVFNEAQKKIKETETL